MYKGCQGMTQECQGMNQGWQRVARNGPGVAKGVEGVADHQDLEGNQRVVSVWGNINQYWMVQETGYFETDHVLQISESEDTSWISVSKDL